MRGAGRTIDAAALERSRWALGTEILMSEILTRVWTGAVAAADRRAGGDELSPAARSILFGHAEARQRVLQRIAADPDRPPRSASRLDQLRRVCERWTDLLLAPLAGICDVAAIAHDAARVADFAQDRRDAQRLVAAQARGLLDASLRSTFRRWPAPPTGNADLNSQIAAAIMACLDCEQLDRPGSRPESVTYAWLFQARVTSAAAAAQRLVDELLEGG